MPYFKAQELSNMVWAFAMNGPWDLPLFVVSARHAEQHIGEFNLQNLANAALAFATTGQWDVPLFVAFARAAE